MSLTVSFNPTSISDEEREVLQRLVAKPGQFMASELSTRVFEGSAAQFTAHQAAGSNSVKGNGVSGQEIAHAVLLADPKPLQELIAQADNPATGATSPAEAFGLATPETTPAAAFSPADPRIQVYSGQVLEGGGVDLIPFLSMPPKLEPLAWPPVAVETGIPVSGVAAVATPSRVELDSEDLPYDARIHSSSREKIKNGTWKIKRGTGETFIIQVKNELRAALNAPASVQPASVPTAPQPAPVLTIPPTVAPVEAWPFPTPPAAVTPPPATTGPTTLPEFMKEVGARISSGKLSESSVHEACAKHGVQFHTLAARPDLIPAVWGSLNG